MNIKKFINSYLNQHIISFHSGAIGGVTRGGHDIERYRRSKPDNPHSKKAYNILIAVPSYAVKGPDMKEVSHAYRAFTKAGYHVDFVTADGSPVKFSQSDLTDPINRWFVEDANAKYSADQPLKAKDIVPERYVAVYFAGGNSLVTDNQWFQSLAEQILSNDGIIAGSGNAEDAVHNLNLTNRIDFGYSIPSADAGKTTTEYGSLVAEAAVNEKSWMIHRDELSKSDAQNEKGIGEQVVTRLAS